MLPAADDARAALPDGEGNDDSGDADEGAPPPVEVEPVAALSKRAEAINNTIAELMIFANEATAKLTFAAFPDLALLRGHAVADPAKFGDLAAAAAALGVSVDTSSNLALGLTLKRAVETVEGRPGSGGAAQGAMLRSLALRAMSRAEYFASGSAASSSPLPLAGAAAAAASFRLRPTPGGAYCEGVMDVRGPPEFGHYGLALGLYTHFTSPSECTAPSAPPRVPSNPPPPPHPIHSPALR